MTPDHFALLKSQEGFRSTPYFDTRGIPTIGYGTNLKTGITTAQASAITAIEVSDNYDTLSKLSWFMSLDEIRRGVIENMCYQMGVDGVLAFAHMIEAIETRDYSTAADEMIKSLWAIQTPFRAKTLSLIMRDGKF